jgi:hypothetical protein
MTIIEEYGTRNQYIEEVAAYIRVSHQEQKLHGLSLESQERLLRTFAENHNMKIVGWYRDEGVSGRKLIKNRPELQRMIQDAEQRKFKRIIFIKLDRFFRSVAEYHECMKRLQTGGVIWTATEEKYDLSTASGEAFVNMKLTMAQFEADQVGERIRMINEYKIQTGQPLFGTQCFPFCYGVEEPEDGDRHKYVAKRDEEIMYDLIDHVMTNHSVRGGMFYINKKYNKTYAYNTVMNALTNEMLYGMYRGNPNYCPPYMTKESFDKLQSVIKRNPRTSPSEHTYVFTGLVKCPGCGTRLGGAVITNNQKGANGKKRVYRYYGYRCRKHTLSKACNFASVVFERRLEAELLSAIEKIIAKKQMAVVDMQNTSDRVGKHDLEALHQELERLNYSWKKGRIKNVEEYDRDYDELMAKIEEAQAEHESLNEEPDYEKIKQVISGDWKKLYESLDAEHKRSFWRSFVEEISIEWNKETKRVNDINFFS